MGLERNIGIQAMALSGNGNGTKRSRAVAIPAWSTTSPEKDNSTAPATPVAMLMMARLLPGDFVKEVAAA